MAQSKVLTGSRALVYVDNILVGLYDSCTWNVVVGAEAQHILGRYSAAEITQTSYEAVQVNCSGFRIIGNGGHILPKFPKLQDLLNLETVNIAIVDRKQAPGSEPIMKVDLCIPTNYGTGVQAKQSSRIQVSYLGVKHSDESGEQDEVGAANLPE